MWLRDFRSPPKALALFQVYHRFAPLTDFRGLTWRIQVEEDVCLQAFLVAGPPQGSFLHVRRGTTLELQPPLLRIEGQLESLFLNELPLESWIARGTRWWLRNLGSVLVDKPLRLTLLNALVDMDRTRFPELESAIAYHPIIPLVNGDWISLDQLRTYSQVFQSQSWTKGWHGGVPVVQAGGAMDRIQELLDAPVSNLEGQNTPEPIHWSYALETDAGRVTLSLLGSDYKRSSNWIVGDPRQPHFRAGWLFDENPLSLMLTCDYRGPMPEGGLPPYLRNSTQKAIVAEAGAILARLQAYPSRLHEICSLLTLMLETDQQPHPEIWNLPVQDDQTLLDVRQGKIRPPGRFPSDHPIHCLRPGHLNPVLKPTSVFQLHWTQRCESQELHVHFLERRDSISTLSANWADGRSEECTLQLWPDWPLSLSLRLTDHLQPGGKALERWSPVLKKGLEKHWETPLRLLLTYPEALEEVCCIVGIGLQSGRRPPGWVWDFQDSQGRMLGELIQAPSLEHSGQHPLNRLQKLLNR